MIRALIPLLVALPLAAVMPQRPVSEVRIGIASASAPRPTIAAAHGEQMLVAWHSLQRGGQALLIDANGQPLTETPIGLPVNEPLAAFWRHDSWTIISQTSWVRVSESGALLDRAANTLATPNGVALDAVWTGEALIVLLQQGEKLLAVTFDASLHPRGTRDLGPAATPVVASDGDGAMVILHEPHRRSPMHALLFDASGTFVRERTLNVPYTARAIGTQGDGYLIFASDNVPENISPVWVLRIDEQLDFRVVEQFAGDGRLHSTSDDVSWDGSAFTFLYTADAFEGAFIRAARVAPNGTLLEDVGVVPMGNFVHSRGTYTSAGTMGTTIVIHPTREEDHGPYFLQLRAGRSGAALAGTPDVPLERGAFQQINPAVATTATEALVVWQERVTAPNYRVYATRVDSRGRVLDPQSITLGETTPYTSVAVASNGTDYLVAWHEEAGIRVTHVRADGSVAATSLVTRVDKDAATSGNVQLFSNGTDYLLLWAEARHLENRSPVHVARIHADGRVAKGLPSMIGSFFGGLRGTSNGRDYLLANLNEVWLVSGADARILAHFTIAGFGPLGLWWDGAVYNVAQIDNSAIRLVRVTPEGATTTSERASHWPPTALDMNFRMTLCDSAGCTGITAVVEKGRSLLREVRISGEPSATIGRTAEIAPLLVQELRTISLANAPQLVPFRLQGRTFAAFAHAVSEAPYAGIHRLFIVPMQELSRTRAVRH
ncbi:MAG TPA: hypothetical protein VHK90_04080 [Thermoanaerobaculia bacterium]|nr:hypothetical protein [Thermoanaerobaculia bacterium]